MADLATVAGSAGAYYSTDLPLGTDWLPGFRLTWDIRSGNRVLGLRLAAAVPPGFLQTWDILTGSRAAGLALSRPFWNTDGSLSEMLV